MRFAQPLLRSLTLTAALFLLSTTAYADRPAFLVDSTWLEDHSNDPSLVLLEVRYYPNRYFTVGHIPGARQVQRFSDLGDNHAVPVMRHPSMEAFQATLRGWGVNDDSLVVICDDSRTALASRIYFLLNLFGFDMDRVRIMEGCPQGAGQGCAACKCTLRLSALPKRWIRVTAPVWAVLAAQRTQ